MIFFSLAILALFILLLFHNAQNLPAIPVLKYHHVNDVNLNPLTISPADFERQITALKDMGFESIFLSDLEDMLYRQRKVASRKVAITFDDGFFDNYSHVFPILKKLGFKATIFLSTIFIKEARDNRDQKVLKDDFRSALLQKDYSGFLNWQQVKEMHESGLVDIEPHTHYHRHRFKDGRVVSKMIDPEGLDLKTISCFDEGPKRGGLIYGSGASLVTRAFDPATSKVETEAEYLRRITDEIRLSKEAIELKLKKKCRYIAWPWGLFNRAVVNIARKMGFTLCLTTFYGSNHFLTSRQKIKRFTPAPGPEKFNEEMLRNSYLLPSLLIDDKMYNIFCRRFIARKLREIKTNG